MAASQRDWADTSITTQLKSLASCEDLSSPKANIPKVPEERGRDLVELALNCQPKNVQVGGFAL